MREERSKENKTGLDVEPNDKEMSYSPEPISAFNISMPPGMAKLCAARPTEANGSSSMTGTRVSEIVSVMNASLIPKRPTPAATRRRCSLLRMLLSLRECRSNRRGEGLRRSSGLRYGWMCQPETRWVNLVSLRSRGVMTAWWGPMSASIELSVGLSVSLLQEWTENGGWYSSSRDCKCGCIVYLVKSSTRRLPGNKTAPLTSEGTLCRNLDSLDLALENTAEYTCFLVLPFGWGGGLELSVHKGTSYNIRGADVHTQLRAGLLSRLPVLRGDFGRHSWARCMAQKNHDDDEAASGRWTTKCATKLKETRDQPGEESHACSCRVSSVVRKGF